MPAELAVDQREAAGRDRQRGALHEAIHELAARPRPRETRGEEDAVRRTLCPPASVSAVPSARELEGLDLLDPESNAAVGDRGAQRRLHVRR